MSDPRKITREELDNFLPEGDWIHVFSHPGLPEGSILHRKWVIEMFNKYGAEVGPLEYCVANHGIVIVESPEKWYSVENRRTEKK